MRFAAFVPTRQVEDSVMIPNQSQPNQHGSTADYIDEGNKAGAECLAAALDYLRRGWCPLALCPPDHVGMRLVGHQNCSSPGKRPWHTWKDHQDPKKRPTEAVVRGWWRQVPNSNVGIALGPASGLIRVDVDGEQGEQFLLELSQGDVPETAEMVSGGGGRGLLYGIPPGVELRPTHRHGDKIHEGLSLLGEGAQTVMPPSRHPNGRCYRWREGHGPDDLPIALAPSCLVQSMSRRVESNGRSRPAAGPIGERISDGKRNTTLTSLAGSMRRRGMSLAAILAALHVENEQRCDPPLPEHEVETIAASVARYAPSQTSPERQPAAEIIRDFIISEFGPTFRSGDAIFSQKRGRLLRKSEVIGGAPSALVPALEYAAEMKRDENPAVTRSRVPKLYREWAATAYADLLASLSDEEESAEIAGDAAAAFRRKVAAAFFAQLTLGEEREDKEHGKFEIQVRRSLVEWCVVFAKPGSWKSIRSYLCWSMRGEDGEVRIALRSGLFGQVGPRELAEYTQREFANLAEMYDVGACDRACGQRVVELAADFIAELRVAPNAQTGREPEQDG
jgi:hypothetical protein